MTKYKKLIFLLIAILMLTGFLAVGGAVAQESGEGEGSSGTGIDKIVGDQIQDLAEIGLPGEMEDPADPVVRLIKMVLGFVALVFLILVLYAGFKWMTSAGNSETIDKAKKILSAAIIGLIIIFLSYAITDFIFKVVLSSE